MPDCRGSEQKTKGNGPMSPWGTGGHDADLDALLSSLPREARTPGNARRPERDFDSLSAR